MVVQWLAQMSSSQTIPCFLSLLNSCFNNWPPVFVKTGTFFSNVQYACRWHICIYIYTQVPDTSLKYNFALTVPALRKFGLATKGMVISLPDLACMYILIKFLFTTRFCWKFRSNNCEIYKFEFIQTFQWLIPRIDLFTISWIHTRELGWKSAS